MKITDKILDTLMSEDDKGHVEAIARRHEIVFFDHTMAMMISARSDHQEVLATSTSFSMMSSDGHQGLFLDPDECETADEAYFVALHEIGHSILKHHGNGKDDTENEIEAWQWAISHANRFPEDYTIEMIIAALSTYTDVDEAKARPDSLLALAADPEIWKSHGYSLKGFKIVALEGLDPVPLVSKKTGKVREVPQPIAKMIGEYIQLCQDFEHQGYVRNMEKTLSDPDMKDRIEALKGNLGVDIDDLLKRMEEFKKKYSLDTQAASQ